MTGFGMAHLQAEGAPSHPSYFFWECWCQGCQWRWERQLREYADWHRVDPPALERGE